MLNKLSIIVDTDNIKKRPHFGTLKVVQNSQRQWAKLCIFTCEFLSNRTITNLYAILVNLSTDSTYDREKNQIHFNNCSYHTI